MSDAERGRLVAPDLDDRKWKDLVENARALIPTYAPQWTDHNPSDVGMTLIELFAYLVEGLTYRLNRVPDKNYIQFLNLLGITRDPATPARAFLTFTAAPGGPVPVPAKTQAQTRAVETDPPIVFETDEDLTVLPTNLKVALTITKPSGNKYTNVSNLFTVAPASGSLITVPVGQAVMLALGFDQPVAQEIQIRFRLFRPFETDPTTHTPQAFLFSGYSTAGADPPSWPIVPVAVDETQGLMRDGVMRFTVPATWASQMPTAWVSPTANSVADQVSTPLYWLGVRIVNVVSTPITVGISSVLFNSVSSYNALTIPAPEALGSSNGKPFQVFALRQRPLFKRLETDTPYDHLVVKVAGTPWTAVAELLFGPANAYRFDPVAGEVSFGNYDPASNTGHGTIPPVGAAIEATTYRYVAGGTSGSVGAGTIVQMRSPVAGIVAVTNLASSYGASDEEPIDDTKRRAPEVLRNRYRAVTVEDFEYLAREATTDVVIVRCLPPRLQDADSPNAGLSWKRGDPWTFGAIDRAPGNVNLIVAPDYGLSETRPQPSVDLVHELLRYLDARRPITSKLIVTGPRYVPIKATVQIAVFQQAIDNGIVASAPAVATQVRGQVEKFFHPVHGGPDGEGWQVGQAAFISDLFSFIAPAERVGFISTIALEPLVPVYHDPPLGPGGAWNDPLERPFTLALATPRAAVRLADYELVCSATGSHNITATVVS
jgi:baseplate J-like protein